MRLRILPLFLVVALMIPMGCAGERRQAAGTPVPTKTLRPTFTHTPEVPTQPPATPTPEVPPTATPEPATATPEVPTDTPTPEAARLVVTAATSNVRSGPGTNYAKLGSVGQGESFEVIGKNPAGDWWQFQFNGQPGWVRSDMVSVTGPELVQVAQDIPAPPVAPKPKPAPQPTSPPPTAAPSYPFAAALVAPYPNTQNYVTVRCRTVRDVAVGKGAAGTLLVTGPVSSQPQAFGSPLNTANTGMDKNMRYMYNENCKVELVPFVPGTYTGILVDGSGRQISDPIQFTPSGDIREFILVWNPR